MHIAMLTWEYPPRIVGGIARHVVELSPALVAHGHEVTVLTMSVDGAPAREEPIPGLRVVRANLEALGPYDLESSIHHLNFALAAEATALHREHPIDIIHAHDWLTAFAGETLRIGLGAPLVATLHATEHGRHYGIHTPQQAYISQVEWWMCYRAWRVIVCSDYMRDHAQWLFGLPWDKLRVVPNGVDAWRFDSPPPEGYRRQLAMDDERIVFFVGRMVREKGVPSLIEAAPGILAGAPRTKFVIAGGGDRSALVARVHELGIAEKFLFLGFVPDEQLPWLYRAADVAVFPSLHEPFGIVALEAMAAGTPVIVSDVGGLGSIIRHGDNGFKCYPDNPDSIRWQVLHAFHQHPDAWDSAAHCAERAWTEVREVYNWDRLAGQTEDVYGEIAR